MKKYLSLATAIVVLLFGLNLILVALNAPILGSVVSTLTSGIIGLIVGVLVTWYALSELKVVKGKNALSS